MIVNPYKFNVGDRVMVIQVCKHQGMIGKVVKRKQKVIKEMQWAEETISYPPPENIYYVVFKEEHEKYGFGEGNLVSAEANE